MAFGIDDALMAAAAGINLTDTVVATVQKYKGRRRHDLDIDRLIDEVRIAARERIDEADLALTRFERLLNEKGVDTSKTLQQVIESTPWWQPFEEHRLKGIRRSFNALADATYSASDDIAALVRCKDQIGDLGVAVVDSTKSKHELFLRILNAESVKVAIDLLRSKLADYKRLLV